MPGVEFQVTVSHTPRPAAGPDIYRILLYDLELEEQAMQALSELDLAGCRRALSALVDGLALGRGDGTARSAVLLMLDLLQRVNRRLHRGPGTEARYRSNRASLVEAFGGCDRPEIARRLFVEWLGRLLAGLGRSTAERCPHVERAKQIIEEGCTRRISLSDVARTLHISPNYLSRLFRRETGTTLTAYVHRVRLDRATLLLAQGAHSISEIAYRVGYQNYRDFYRNFVKYERVAPGEFRRRFADRGPQGADPARDPATPRRNDPALRALS